MVIAGIQSLSKSKKPAIRAYFEHTQKNQLTSEDIAFFLAPILNSAGRMEDASYSVNFLISKNIYDARVRLNRLIDFNTVRKATEQDITQKAIEQVNSNDQVIIVTGQKWHEGVVGIVAARVARIYEKPCIVLTETDEGLLKGSGRSFGKCDLFNIVNGCREYLEKFGGHKAAIGLSLKKENLKYFKEKVEKTFNENLYINELVDQEIIGKLHFSEINFNLINLIKKFEPYGQGNPKPKFISNNVKILKVETMGKEGEHLRFTFIQDNIVMQAVKFKSREIFTDGQVVSISYTVNENHFRDNINLQLMVDMVTIKS
jgi:single-stranded-DNA-specific exonuclease